MKRFISRPRIPGFDYIGPYAYHLTLVTRNREAILLASVADDAVRALNETATTTAFDALAFTVMPDHLHALILGGTDKSNLIRFVQRFKQRTSYAHKRRTGHPMWQPSFFDHAVRGEEDLAATARYIIDNPVRAGLAERAADWPHSGGTLLSDGRS